ncbi:PP2C family protein-serine/threonine phosphatase [Plantactinospora endophytica]|nr:PP2C family protein-serine/threonine phosphatase [Plantactinospora endophytica]
MDTVVDVGWCQALRTLLDRAHLVTPSGLAALVAEAAGPLGLRPTIWLIDYEQTSLHAMPVAGRETPGPIPVDGSLPGRAFASVVSLYVGGSGTQAGRWWVPVVNGTERFGLIEFTPVDGTDGQGRDFVTRCELLAGLVGHLLGTIMTGGDGIEQLRRTRPMSVAAELLWRQLPPLTSSTEAAVVTAILQPCYDVGGDGFDYVLENTGACLLVLDAMGRGLGAGLACAVALAAIRATRRAGRGLYDQARAADAALLDQFQDARFATAVLAELDLETGRLRYVNAGHPAPLLLRGGRLVRQLSDGRRMPLGVDDPSVEVAEESLEPGDRLLLYTDGVTEARADGGERFGVDRLVDLTERHAGSGLPAPETLRRLAHTVTAHQGGPPADDATLMLVEWSATASHRTVPGARQVIRDDEGRS